jgi:CheY-like chemotaxis protein
MNEPGPELITLLGERPGEDARPSIRVLVVEDSHEDYELCVRALESGGYRVVADRVDTRESLELALETSC